MQKMRGDKRQRGFTLIELLAVMAIIGILAAIVVPAVSGTGETGRTATSQQSASGVQSGLTNFFNDQTAGETLTSEEVLLTTQVNGTSVATTTQTISSRWPELFITAEGSATSTSEYFKRVPHVGQRQRGCGSERGRH